MIPQMGKQTLHMFERLLSDIEVYLEYGSGGSTVFAAVAGVKSIYSVESDKVFLDAVRLKVKEVNSISSFHPIYVDIGAVGPWGKPVKTEKMHDWYRYSQSGFHACKRDNVYPDLVLIDGRFRVASFLTSILLIKAGDVILFDDYATRSKYKIVEEIVKPKQIIECRSALFVKPKKIDLVKLSLLLAKYSVVYA